MSSETQNQFNTRFDPGGENAALLPETGTIVSKNADRILKRLYETVLSREETQQYFPDQRIVAHAKWRRNIAQSPDGPGTQTLAKSRMT